LQWFELIRCPSLDIPSLTPPYDFEKIKSTTQIQYALLKPNILPSTQNDGLKNKKPQKKLQKYSKKKKKTELSPNRFTMKQFFFISM
jgi:hypothetical protein